ncbi:MAG: mannose-1-phosphate guanylyltransferase [Chloroflexi bacterium]|nr:mannose-1-phosphate guanylyltransferase [Chloroflexota bacterium]
MLEHTYAVIMAGGGGTRLWPLSRRANPKQMLRLGAQRTLFQQAVDRLSGLIPVERIWVVTVAEQALELGKQCPDIPEQNFLLEPMPKGTASVVGFAAAALSKVDANASMIILTADHFIQNISVFHACLKSAVKVAQAGFLVTLGIEPTYPATGYGYIQQGAGLDIESEVKAYQVVRFKEKPNLETAQKMLESGEHAWNSGMFIWRVDRILEEFASSMPGLYEKLMEIQAAWGGKDQKKVVDSVWPTLHPETIDYGIMEKASQVAVLPAHQLGWDDVGSWDSLFDVLEPDEQGNIVLEARHIGMGTKGSLICGETSNRMIVTLGVENMIVVDTGDAVLICPRGNSQRVRDLVNHLKEQGLERYL